MSFGVSLHPDVGKFLMIWYHCERRFAANGRLDKLKFAEKLSCTCSHHSSWSPSFVHLLACERKWIIKLTISKWITHIYRCYRAIQSSLPSLNSPKVEILTFQANVYLGTVTQPEFGSELTIAFSHSAKTLGRDAIFRLKLRRARSAKSRSVKFSVCFSIKRRTNSRMSLKLPPGSAGWSMVFAVAPWPADCCFFGVRGFRFFVSFARIDTGAMLAIVGNGLEMWASLACRWERGGGVVRPGPKIKS